MEVLVLGPVEVHDERGALDAGPPKQRALLALLASRADTVVPVDTLVDRLWDGVPPGRAEAGLQVYVSNLRRVLEPARSPRAEPTVLVRRGTGYMLSTRAAELDVRRFEHLTARGAQALAAGAAADAVTHLEAALALWRGEAYADVRDVRGLEPEAARLESLRLDAVEELAAARLAAGRTAQVAADLRLFVDAHPLRERASELLALALYRSGRQGEALEALARARDRLRDELGIDPGPSLRAVELAVLRQDEELLAPALPRPRPAGDPDVPGTAAPGTAAPTTAAPPGATVPGAAPPGPTAPATGHGPFVGREAPLRLLAEALEAARERARVVLVEGEPGVGKTRLVAEFTRACDVTTAWGACPEHEVAPALWPWEAVLRSLAAARPDVALPPDVQAFLAGRGQASDLQDATGARLRLYDSVASALAAVAPVVVVVDDLQWADTTSARLLVHVARVAPPGVLVVATCRSTETSALTETLGALTRAGAQRVPLTGLGPEQVRALVGRRSGTDPGEEAALAVHARTGGNPLFVSLLADVAAEDLDETPRRLRDVVLQRLAGLGPDVAAVLRVAAVAGQDVDAAVLAEVVERSPDEVADLLDEARAAGLLADDDTPLGTYRFTHALVREALDGEHSRLRRARLHRRYGEATERRYGIDDEHAGRLARHWLAAAELGPDCAQAALVHTARAARAAMRRLAPEDAVPSWQECLVAERIVGGAPAMRFEALLGLIEAHYASGATTEGSGYIDAALDVVQDDLDDDPRLVVRAAVTVLGQSTWYPFAYGFVPQRLLDALGRAVPRLEPASADLALALACLGALQCQAGLLEESPATAAEAVRVAEEVAAHRAVPDGAAGEPGRDVEFLARVLCLATLALHGVDHAEAGLATARRLLALPGASPTLVAAARIFELSTALFLGRLEDAAVSEAAVPAAVEAARSPTLWLQGAFARAALLAFRGDLDGSETVAAAAYAPAAAIGSEHVLTAWTTHRCDVALQRRELSGLETELAEVRRRTGIDSYGATQAMALARAGRPDEAREVLAAVRWPPKDYTWIGSTVSRLMAALELGELGVVAEVREQLRPYRERFVVLGTCTAVLGVVSAFLGEAAAALGETEVARRDLTHALDLLERVGAPFWAARARGALAALPA